MAAPPARKLPPGQAPDYPAAVQNASPSERPRGPSPDIEDRRHATTERKVRYGFAVAIAFLGAIGLVSYLSVVRLTDNSRLVTRSHAVISDIDALVATTFEAESSQRAYIISGEEQFAVAYASAATRVERLLLELRAAVRDQPAQLARIDPLAAAVRGRLKRSQEIVELRRGSGMEAVQRRLAQSENRPGVSLQQEIRRLAQNMKAAEFEHLESRELLARRSAVLTKAVIVGGSALALLFVAVALLAIRRDFAGRARAEAELSRFFDLSIDLFAIADADGYFRRVSPAIADMLGYSVAEAQRIPYMELIHPEDRERARDAVAK